MHRREFMVNSHRIIKECILAWGVGLSFVVSVTMIEDGGGGESRSML